jgi:hypothetical protein
MALGAVISPLENSPTLKGFPLSVYSNATARTSSSVESCIQRNKAKLIIYCIFRWVEFAGIPYFFRNADLFRKHPAMLMLPDLYLGYFYTDLSAFYTK